MSSEPRADLYVSVDIETDGPIPGPYSMLAFAMVPAGRYDGHAFQRAPADAQSFYAELKPISTSFDPEAMSVNGMDREALLLRGLAPEHAMRDAAAWVRELAGEDRAVLVAYPVAFDWSFLFWYFIRWCGDSPFGYSSCLDIRTLYQAKARTVHDLSGKRSMPERLLPSAPHTHNALDDAREQGQLFANVFEYVLDVGGSQSRTDPLLRVGGA
jgi:hypothetical protein